MGPPRLPPLYGGCLKLFVIILKLALGYGNSLVELPHLVELVDNRWVPAFLPMVSSGTTRLHQVPLLALQSAVVFHFFRGSGLLFIVRWQHDVWRVLRG